MKKFIFHASLFFLLPAVIGLFWTIFVVVMDWRSYSRALTMPEDATIAVCGDSQTKDGLDPALVPGLFNFSTAATTCDQDLLRLLDLLVRNRGKVRHVLLDASPLKVGYSTEKPVSELNSGRVHALLYAYHPLECRRAFGSLGTLWRDVVCTRKYNEFRKSILRGKSWRSSMAGGFDPGKEQGFLNPKFRARALADVVDKAARVNACAPANIRQPFFSALTESAGLVRAAGATPIFTTMPLSRQLRTAIDATQLEAFRKAMHDVAVRLGVEYLDYLALDLPDTYWHDGNHLNREGARMFSVRFAGDLAAVLSRMPSISPDVQLHAEIAGVTSCPRLEVDFSGLSHAGGDLYWVVRDVKGEICEVKIPLDRTTGRALGCEVLRSFKIPGNVDLEAVAFDPLRSTPWISDENNSIVAEFIPSEGRIGRRVDLPQDLRGVQKRRGIEALEISPDGLTMWMCNENELPADDSAAPEPNEFVRLTRLTRRTADGIWHLSGQWAYRPATPGGLSVRGGARNGVVSLCVLPDGNLLVLEREKTAEKKKPFRVRIYRVDFDGATDIRGWSSLAYDDFTPVRKRRLFDGAPGTASYEGICCGSVLDDGTQTILLVSDGNDAASGTLMTLRLVSKPNVQPTSSR